MDGARSFWSGRGVGVFLDRALIGGGGGARDLLCVVFIRSDATLPSSELRGKTDHGGGSGSRAPP